MLRNRDAGAKIISDINITPLTDVMLVLLIIFMVTATFFVAEPAMRVRLPSAVTGQKATDESQEISVTISKDGGIEVEGKQVALEGLVEELIAAARAVEGSKIVRIRADREVRYSTIIFAMDAARLVGLNHIALATETAAQPEGQAKSGL